MKKAPNTWSLKVDAPPHPRPARPEAHGGLHLRLAHEAGLTCIRAEVAGATGCFTRPLEALGELRSGVGLQAAVIAKAYGLDVDDEFASTLPRLASDDN